MKNDAIHPSTWSEHRWTNPLVAQMIPYGLDLVTENELEQLRSALAHGRLPADLETKLQTLAQGSLLHCSVEQNCRLFVSLLLASEHSSFNDATRRDLDRLLRVLAYVRKENDTIADCKPNGFVDDQQQVRAAVNDVAEVIQRFKTWTLRTQVPDLWLK
jgi:hypothetical protein